MVSAAAAAAAGAFADRQQLPNSPMVPLLGWSSRNLEGSHPFRARPETTPFPPSPAFLPKWTLVPPTGGEGLHLPQRPPGGR